MKSRSSTISVLLADDHRLVREGLRALLNQHSDIEVVGEAEDGQAALELAAELEPAVLVLDASMPRVGGFEVLRKLSDWPEAPAVIMCSMFNDVLPSAVTLGADAYVEKRAAAMTLVQTIREVAQNGAAERKYK